MVRIYVDGTDGTVNDLPWYEKTTFTCPRCQCQFRLDESDFIVSHGPFIGVNLNYHLYWIKAAATDPTVPYPDGGTTGFPNTYWPDWVYGPCPHCGMNPITLKAPDFGSVHPTGATDPVLGQLQNYVAAGVTGVTFHRTNAGTLVGVFLLASGAFYLPDTLGTTVQAIVRTATNTLNPSYRYLLATPGRPVTVAVAQSLDSALCTLLGLAGMTLVGSGTTQ